MTIVRKALLNISLILGSLFILLLMLEFIVFRYLFLPSDLPYLEENVTGVLKYAPNQEGVYRLQDEIAANYRINSSGWNSRYEKYEKQKDLGITRICIIGDSYIEALQVSHNASVAELLEKHLNELGIAVQVYRFGISGAPLSHYIFMLENELLEYCPDLIVVNIVHNDFDESIKPPVGTYTESFSRVRSDGRKELFLTEPKVYKRKPSWWLKRSSTFRYIWVRRQIRPDIIRHIWMRYFDNQSRKSVFVANVDVEKTKDKSIVAVTDFLFQKLGVIEKKSNTRILVIMDGDRSSITASIDNGDDPSSQVDHLSLLARKSAEKYSLLFLDLTDRFVADYRANKKKLRFNNDGHWNEHVHDVVADAIKEKLLAEQLL